MNNPQIVENCRFLERKVTELSDQLEGARNVIYQLIGGLFNQETQSGIIDMHNDSLFPECEQKFKYDMKESIWPTTRQGDELERRVADLEKKLETVLAQKN
jgi:hypothetical protein